MISGLVTLAAFVSFIGIAIWAWSRHNRARFEAASRLPLDDESVKSSCCCKGDRP
ncbi:MAG: cbb3-type cytochrome oxidase subunit 3 [Panacagrimonas sp.]